MKLCIAWDSEITGGEQEIRLCELNEDGVYIVDYHGTGKREILRSLDFRFEVLFEVGAYALLDSYYREAVSSFSAALERFYGLFVEAVARTAGVSPEVYAKCWKHLSNASERQLGAFISANLLTRQSCPDLLPDRSRTFRNAVIHKGTIPGRDAAMAFGDTVGNQIIPDLEYLLENHRSSLSTLLSEQLAIANEKLPSEEELRVDRLSTFFLARVLSHREATTLSRPWRLEDRLQIIRRYPRKLWIARARRAS